MLWEGSPACARLPSAVAVLWATLGPRAPGLGPWALGVGPWALGLGTLALSGSGRTSLTMLWEGSPACARLPSAVAVLWAALGPLASGLGLRHPLVLSPQSSSSRLGADVIGDALGVFACLRSAPFGGRRTVGYARASGPGPRAFG